MHRSHTRELVGALSEAFRSGRLNLSTRSGSPNPGWDAMPEYRIAHALEGKGASGDVIRLVLTFGCAMDRARDADRLADCIIRLFEREPLAFDPFTVSTRSLEDLQRSLSATGVSQRHRPDSAAWYQIAQTLHLSPADDPIRRAIWDGVGSASDLLRAVRIGRRFPMLRGPKVSVMWVRMLAWPGGASIANLDTLPVAVDTQVKKVSEYLGVTRTAHLPVSSAKPIIERAWQAEVAAAEGPGSLAGTAAALDPALWFFGKWGCTYCERAGRRLPISEVCSGCTYTLNRGAPVA